jgi:hypothetical protein
MWSRVNFVSIDLSEECVTSIYRVEIIRELGTTLGVTSSFHLEDVGNKFLRNIGSNKTHTAPHPRRRHSSNL